MSSADDGMSGRGPADPEEDSDYMDGGLAEKEPATAGARKKPDVATLSPMAGQVIQSKEITKRLRLKELLRLLAELTEFDETADQLRDKARSRAFIFLGLTIAAFFGTFFAVVIPFLPLVTLLAGVVFFILMIVTSSRNGVGARSTWPMTFAWPYIHFYSPLPKISTPRAAWPSGWI